MKSNDQLKKQQLEVVKQEKTKEAATQMRLKEAKDQQILEKLERLENRPKQFSYKSI
jgi:hypothetical protein